MTEVNFSMALFGDDDMIIDGPTHQEMLTRILRHATERVIIQSTPVNDAAISFLCSFGQRLGLRIDLMRGQDEVGTDTSPSRAAVDGLNEKPEPPGASTPSILDRLAR